MLRKIGSVLFVLCLAVGLTACFDIEQNVELNEDLSGSTRLKMGVSFEPMAVMMAAMQKSFSGDESPPTAEEIETARQEMLSQKESQKESFDFDAEKAKMEKELPEGITLQGMDIRDEGLEMVIDLALGFDHVSKLSGLDLAGNEEEQEGQVNPMPDFFDNLQVREEGEFIIVENLPSNPKAVMEEQSPMPMSGDEEGMEMFEEMFKDLRFAFTLKAPFEVVEHNATRKDGDTLIWEYDVEALEALGESEVPEGIKVRYRRGG